MATGQTTIYELPYPLSGDPVNVHGDIQDLSERLETILSTIGTPFISHEVRNISGSSISKGTPVYITGYSTKTTIDKCDSDNLETFPVFGLMAATTANNNDGVVIISGVFSNINTSSFTAGDILYVANGGGLTNSQPATGSGAIGIVAYSNASNGIIIVGQPKGNGTWGSLKAGLA